MADNEDKLRGTGSTEDEERPKEDAIVVVNEFARVYLAPPPSAGQHFPLKP